MAKSVVGGCYLNLEMVENRRMDEALLLQRFRHFCVSSLDREGGQPNAHYPYGQVRLPQTWDGQSNVLASQSERWGVNQMTIPHHASYCWLANPYFPAALPLGVLCLEAYPSNFHI